VVKATFPFYVVRLGGGLLYLTGMLVMAWNVWKTATGSSYRPVRIPLAVASA
jgi:cytochrome c oxidase cbb3-type subunit 1